MRTIPLILTLLALAPAALATEIPSSYQVAAVRGSDGAAFLGFAWATREGDAVHLWLFDALGDEKVDLLLPATVERTTTSGPDARVIEERWKGEGVTFAAGWLDDALVGARPAAGGGSIAGYAVSVRAHT